MVRQQDRRKVDPDGFLESPLCTQVVYDREINLSLLGSTIIVGLIFHALNNIEYFPR